jgi:hypothetical protein
MHGTAGANGAAGAAGTSAPPVVNSGGGIFVFQDTAAAIHNCTIALNKVTAGAGGGLGVVLDGTSDPVSVISTIIAMNSAKTDQDITGTVSADHDLIQNPGSAVLNGGAGDLTGQAKLGPLGKHGGPTLTMLLLKGSPALGHGVNPDNLQTDQRGLPRDDNGVVDIGAVQVTGNA